jgi:hypothetical protein
MSTIILNEQIDQIKLKLDLNYDEKSVGILENQIDWMSEQSIEYDIKQAINEYALFYGQCLIHVYNGDWLIDPITYKRVVSIKPFLAQFDSPSNGSHIYPTGL